ncbi:hypothetical protein Tco_1148251, partial [Tanacetum coccineum]
DYTGASLDRKSTIGGCQFRGCRLISWQCKKHTVVANSTAAAEYVAASSCCGQFWATAKAKAVNGEAQIHALVDGKKVIISESTIRRDIHLEDAEGTECLPTATIFEQLTLIGEITVVILVRDRCPRGKGNLPRLPIRINIVRLATPSMGIPTGAVTPNRSIHNIRVHSQCK